MKKIFTTIKDMIVAMLVIAIIGGLGFSGGWFAYEHKVKTENETTRIIENENDLDLQLPYESEKRVITKGEIESKLVECAEFSTYCGNYKVMDYEDSATRSCFDCIDIIGTTNYISVSCQGTVKVGYDVTKIVVEVDDNTIYISLPEPTVTDNYVIWDTVEAAEKNNIFNPIEFSQYQDLIGGIEEDGLKKVEEDGIYEKAEENMKKVVLGFLSEFNDYTVVFM